jgi:hypothetical protein
MKSFINVLKNWMAKRGSWTQNKTGREMHQLLEANWIGKGRKDLLKETCKPVDKGCVEKAWAGRI